jgi:hypothetical protein
MVASLRFKSILRKIVWCWLKMMLLNSLLVSLGMEMDGWMGIGGPWWYLEVLGSGSMSWWLIG